MLSGNVSKGFEAPDLSAVLKRNDGVIEAVVDGDLVLMNPEEFTYFGASGSGRVIWELIDGHRAIASIIADLTRQYDGDPDTIREETVDFLGAMVAAGLVRSIEPAE